MKRITASIAIIVLAFCFAGCGTIGSVNAAKGETFSEDKPTAAPTESNNPTMPIEGPGTITLTPSQGERPIRHTPSLGSPIEFSYQRIRTNGYISGAKYPKTCVISSSEDLNDYYKSASGTYSMDSFKEAITGYDDAWFKSHVLIIVVLEEGSGSVGHQVTSVSKLDNKLNINIAKKIPEIGTADMAQWHILIELSSDDYNGETPVITISTQR
jgi:hypothetical protein